MNPFGQHCVYHFDLALTAVRATSIVENALNADKLVRQEDMFPIEKLGSQVSPPSLSEFSAILDLHRFGNIAAYIIMGHVGRLRSLQYMRYRPNSIDSWDRRFYRALCRLTICGAALSGAYLEPFLHTNIPRPAGFLYRILWSRLMLVGKKSDNLPRYNPTSSNVLPILYEPTNSDLEY